MQGSGYSLQDQKENKRHDLEIGTILKEKKTHKIYKTLINVQLLLYNYYRLHIIEERCCSLLCDAYKRNQTASK